MRRAIALVLSAWLALPGLAVDRHVFLDTDQDGQLNDCPNPDHNVKGTNNTDELQYCSGGSSAGKLIGTVAGAIASGTCTDGGGSVANVTSNLAIDADHNGTVEANEAIYGHPQACMHFFAKSDSCEVHAGVYWRPGAQFDNHAGDFSNWAGTEGTCDGFACHYSSVLAWGQGPNMGTTGYGTPELRGFLRGAVMNGSTDTWDSDGDRKPDTEAGEPTSYAVILSGNADNDGTLFERTDCTGTGSPTTCTGDAFSALMVGCGSARGTSYQWCGSFYDASAPEAERGPYIDTDANGTFDTEYGRGQTPRDTSFLVIKDVEFRDYNGGNVCTSGCDLGSRQAHPSQAHIMLNGDGSSDGMLIDHVYVHGNDYSWTPSLQIQMSIFADPENFQCSLATEVTNSFIVQNNEDVWNADGGQQNGCELNWHDTITAVEITSGRGSGRAAEWGYFKQSDYVGAPGSERIRVNRYWNSDLIVRTTTAQYQFMDLTMGNPCCDTGALDDFCPSDGGPPVACPCKSCTVGSGQTCTGGNDIRCPGDDTSTYKGTFLVYGSLFRRDPQASTGPWQRFGGEFCHDDCDNARWIQFNNTLDSEDPARAMLEASRSIHTNIERNNAWFGWTSVHAQTATNTAYTAEVCSQSGQPSCTQNTSGRTGWFTPGSFAANDPDYWEGATNYVPDTAGPLFETGSCDPDGDGQPGFRLSGIDVAAVHVTTWQDMLGNVINCPTTTSPISIGAIQPNSDTVTTVGTTTKGVTGRGTRQK